MQFMFNYHTEQDDELVEILDANKQPFMITSLFQAQKQALSFQAVITLLHGPQKDDEKTDNLLGRAANNLAGHHSGQQAREGPAKQPGNLVNNRANAQSDEAPQIGLYVQQRSKFSLRYPECWDVSAIRHVRAGESTQEAATRSLYEELGVRCTQCNYKAHLKPRPDFENIKLAVFHALAPATTPAPDHRGISRLLCLGPKELEVLLRDFKEQTTPALRMVLESGLAFP